MFYKLRKHKQRLERQTPDTMIENWGQERNFWEKNLFFASKKKMYCNLNLTKPLD